MMFAIKMISYVLFLLLPNCQISAILNGDSVFEKEYPWLAQVVGHLKKTKTYCTGSIISDNFILTAGHCIFGAESVSYALGDLKHFETDSAGGAGEHIVTGKANNFYVHPCYVKNINQYQYDLALLKFEEHIDPKLNYTTPIMLPVNDVEDFIGYKAKTAGWGASSSKGPVPNPFLLVGKLSCIDKSKCITFYENDILQSIIKHENDYIICAIGEYQAACEGDAGAPLFYFDEGYHAYFLIGVNTFSHPESCKITQVPQGYVNINKHLEWIDDILNIEEDNKIPPVGCLFF